MCLRCRVSDQGFRSAKAFGELDQFDAFEDVSDKAFATGSFGNFKGNHAAEAGGLFEGNAVPFMGWQAGVVDFSDFRAGGEPSGNLAGGFFLFFQAHRQGFQAAGNEPAVEWRECRAGRQAQVAQAIGDDIRVADKNACQRIVVSGQIFAGAVQNDVGTEFDGTQKYRRQESVVDD